MRLQRFIAASGVCSRRHAELLIAEGRVKVNGKKITAAGTVVDPLHDAVIVDGKSLSQEKPEIYLFCKPAKVVTTMSDPHGRRCLDEFVRNINVRVFPVGRLDFDVTGLLLLTNSGEFAQQLQHPKFEVSRTYWAMVEGTATAESLKPALKGVLLEDGKAKAETCAPLQPSKSTIERLGPHRPKHSLVEISVMEGRNHFVKRLLEELGHPVKKLCRVQFGPYRLGALQPGEIHRTKFRDLK